MADENKEIVVENEDVKVAEKPVVVVETPSVEEPKVEAPAAAVVEPPVANLAATFIGPKKEYYLTQFQKMDATNSYFSWNWAAFFFGFLWMLYRKMYLYALIVWAVLLAASFIPIINGVAWVFQLVGFGLFGNWIYKKKVTEELALASTYEASVREATVASRGGITWVPAIIVGVISIVSLIAICGSAALIAVIAATAS